MAEKDSTKYHYEPYTPLPKPSTANSIGMGPPGPSILRRTDYGNRNSNSNNPDPSVGACCACNNSSQNGPFWMGLLTNLGICALLFAYTLLGESHLF